MCRPVRSRFRLVFLRVLADVRLGASEALYEWNMRGAHVGAGTALEAVHQVVLGLHLLKAAGLGESRGAFGGGEGEDQFASFLVREQAMMMVKAGGIGLTEALFETLKENTNDG